MEETGVTLTETKVAGVTVIVTELTKPALVAEIVAFPLDIPFATPLGLTVKIAVLEDVQVTEFVKLLVEPSVKLPFAFNCTL